MHHNGKAAIAAIGGANQRPMFSFPGEIKLVYSVEECDAACEYLEDFEILGFDTETKTFVDGSGVSSTEAAIVQLCGDDKFGYIFVVHAWTVMYESFKELMANADVRKVANSVNHDKTHLGNRAAALRSGLRSSRLEMKGLFELSGLTKDVMTAEDNETSSGLSDMVDVVLGMVQPNP